MPEIMGAFPFSALSVLPVGPPGPVASFSLERNRMRLKRIGRFFKGTMPMAYRVRVKNWKQFQHFRNRRPPWIKLYKFLLDDPQWYALSGDSAKVLIMIWLIASETDGYLPDINVISFRLRIPLQKLKDSLSDLSHWLERDDISMISPGYQNDIPETEIETEREVTSASLKDREATVISTPQKDADVEPLPALPANGGEKDNGARRLEAGPTPEHLLDLWNKRAHPNLPRATTLTELRKRHVKARLTEHPEFSFWNGLLDRINQSPLLTGQVSGQGHEKWVCTFDWVMNPNNLSKISEGNYDARKRR